MNPHDPLSSRRLRRYARRPSNRPVKPPIRALVGPAGDDDERMARSVVCGAATDAERPAEEFGKIMRNAHGSSTMAATILDVAGVGPKEPGVAMLEQWMTQFIFSQLRSGQTMDADSWRQLSQGIGQVLVHRLTLERVRKMVGKLANPAAAQLVRQMTARAISDRLREVLIGPPLPEPDGLS